MERINDEADRSLVPSGSTEMVRHYTDGKGRARICGGRDLKLSQSYPKEFRG